MESLVKNLLILGGVAVASVVAYNLLEENSLYEEIEAVAEDVMKGVEEALATTIDTSPSDLIEDIGIF